MNVQATSTHPAQTTGRTPLRRVLRSVGAVLAGVVANIVIVGAIDSALRAARVYPPMFRPMGDGLWALALSYRLVVAVLGGLLAARIAATRPMRHALVLGVIETAMTMPFVVINWNKPDFGPHWFGIVAVLSYVPLTVLGGRLGGERAARVDR